MRKELHLHVIYQGNTQIIITTNEEFFSKVKDKFNINPETELEIFEVKKNQKKQIYPKDLRPLMKLEIVSPIDENGTLASKMDKMKERIIGKLQNNSILTGAERQAMIDVLKSPDERNAKRKNTDEDSKTFKSRKLQVTEANLTEYISRETQTEPELMKFAPAKAATTNENVILQSKILASSEKVDAVKAKELMDKTFDDRRIFMQLKCPTVRIVREKYPLLFSLSEVRNEIERIFSAGKCKCFLQNVAKYANGILEMAREDDPLLLKIKEKIAKFPTAVQKKYAKEVGSILMLSSLMNEDRTYLKLQDHPMKTTDLPYLEGNVKFGAIFFDQHTFQIRAEGQTLCEAFNFKEALLCLVGSFYVFDMKYPDSCFNTFMVFEKLYLEGTETDEVDDFTQQIIKSIQLKAAVNE